MAEADVRLRLAAVLAADVAGYTRLMADDEGATIAALDGSRAVFRDHVSSNSGRIVDTAGDSVLAVFDNAAGAVQAALTIQDRLAEANQDRPDTRRMLFRIGIHLGDINEKSDGTIYGDGVNVAARLEGLAEPGRIAVSDTVHGALRGRIQATFTDLGEHEVKNVAEPVRAYQVSAGAGVERIRQKRAFPDSVLAAAAAVVLIATGVVVWAVLDHAKPPRPTENIAQATSEVVGSIPALPTGPSIVVLPFDNLSGDPDQVYFADGITEEITAELSRFRDLMVIARTSAAAYKGQAVDIRDIGRELGVSYVVEGSIRRDADTVRVTAQLVDARDGSHVWAETYERELTAGAIFAVQDDITTRIVSAIGDRHGALARAAREHVIRKPTENLSAYECVLRAYHYQDVHKPEQHLIARDCLEKAIELDPNYVDALAQLAYMYIEEYRHVYNPRPNSIDRAMTMVDRALTIDPNNQLAHWAKAIIHHADRRPDLFLAEAERAIALNPNDAMTVLYMGHYMAPIGEWERGLALVERAIALNPRGPAWQTTAFIWHHMYRREFDRALEILNVQGGNNYLVWMVKTSLLGNLGRAEAAQAAQTELQRVYPGFTIQTARDQAEMRNFQVELVEVLLEGLRKAGVPEA